jgi:hypothetical protein
MVIALILFSSLISMVVDNSSKASEPPGSDRFVFTQQAY